MRLVSFSLSHWYPSTTIVYQAFLLSVADHCFHPPPPPSFKPKPKPKPKPRGTFCFPFPLSFLSPDGLARIAHRSLSFLDKIDTRCLGEYLLEEYAVRSASARPGWLRACFDDRRQF